MSKLDEKWPIYAQVNVLVQKWHLAYFVPINCQFCQIVRYGLQICFALHLYWLWYTNQVRSQLDQNWPFYSPKYSKTHQSGRISIPHFAQVLFTKKPSPPTFLNEFFWKVQNQCKYGFCTNFVIFRPILTLFFCPGFCSEASHVQYCTYGPKTIERPRPP